MQSSRLENIRVVDVDARNQVNDTQKRTLNFFPERRFH